MKIKEMYKNRIKELVKNYNNIAEIKRIIKQNNDDILYETMNDKQFTPSEKVTLFNDFDIWLNETIEEIKAERQKAKEEQERIKLEELTLEKVQKEAEKQLKKEQERMQKIFDEKQATKEFIIKCLLYTILAIVIFSIVVK